MYSCIELVYTTITKESEGVNGKRSGMYKQITVVHSGRSSENENGNRNVDCNIVTMGFQRGTKTPLGTGIKAIHILAKI